MGWLDSITDSMDVNLSKLRGRSGFSFWVGKIPWRKEWLPTPVFLLEEFHGQRSLAGYSPWDRRVGHDWVTNTFSFQEIEDRGACCTAVCGVPKSQARLSDWTTNISIHIYNYKKNKSFWTVSSRNIVSFFTYTHWITHSKFFLPSHDFNCFLCRAPE